MLRIEHLGIIKVMSLYTTAENLCPSSEMVLELTTKVFCFQNKFHWFLITFANELFF